jgi:dihydroorotate dehydrogenase (NAD+) catalytic subunit
MQTKINLSVDIAGIKLRSPIVTASGTFGYGDEITDLVDVSRLGAIITKTITLERRTGNPPPRIFETSSGMLNTIGLQNVGLKEFLENKLDGLLKLSTQIIVSIAGSTCEEYVEITKELGKVKGIAGIELNLSCPNLKKKIICRDKPLFTEIINKTSKASGLPVIAKLSPHVQDIAALALLAQESGAAAVSLVNTFPGMAINTETLRPRLSTVTGGLSGPCIKPIALRCVWEVASSVTIPVIGGGGIATAQDALEFLIAGATAVSVGTACFVDPQAGVKIVDGFEKYMERKNVSHLTEIIGSLKV